jgi:agmatine deiminase
MHTAICSAASGTDVSGVSWRWPAEWEPHEATWLSWPHNPETWPGRLREAEAEYTAMVRALAEREPVRINVLDAVHEEHVRSLLGPKAGAAVACFHHPTDDAWVRDHGPVFVLGPGGARSIVDFGFDSWGGKYPPFERDDAIPRRVAEALGLPRRAADFVLEGGSIDGDGRGTVLTTETCLLNAARRRPGEAERTRSGMERRLAEWLGVRQVIWLGGEVAGDDTDGHVDDLARFVSPGVVVAAVEADASDANHAPLADNLKRLRAARDADGKPLSVATLPMPPARYAAGQRTPASYANFYLANGVALVPVFGVASDARALDVLRELLEGRCVVPVPSSELVVGLGAVHCLTQQEPLGDAESSACSGA